MRTSTGGEAGYPQVSDTAPDRAVPALLFFHGSGGDADDMDATYPAP